MTKTETTKINLNLEDFGALATPIERALNKHFSHLRSTDESISIDIATLDGQLTLDLGTCFGWDEKSESSPSIKFSLVDLVREHLEFALWHHFASKNKEAKERFMSEDAMLYAGPFREQLRECIRLIDAVESHVKADTALQCIKPDWNPMTIHVDWTRLIEGF
jgi:hypothetical protein